MSMSMSVLSLIVVLAIPISLAVAALFGVDSGQKRRRFCSAENSVDSGTAATN